MVEDDCRDTARIVISPMLANIYLHDVLDLWTDYWRKHSVTGDVIIVRYADDFVVGFPYRGEAERFLKELRDRLEKFHLELHPEKTRLIAFGRYAIKRNRQRGKGRPETFDFLGFTHICGEDKRGWFELQRQSIAKRMRTKLQQIKEEIRRRMHNKASDVGRWLRAVVQGWYNDHAVPGNQDRLNAFRDRVTRSWLHVLRRRSHKGRRRWTWERFRRCLVSRWIPTVRIVHPHPTQRLIVNT